MNFWNNRGFPGRRLLNYCHLENAIRYKALKKSLLTEIITYTKITMNSDIWCLRHPISHFNPSIRGR